MADSASLEIKDVSDTALWVAVYRARETERPDALFRDPFAGRLAGERGRKMASTAVGSRYTAWSVVIRTCIIDDFIREQIASGVDLVLNLGAGLDTRPYRLDLPPGLRWVEVDYPHLLDRKEALLAGERPMCRLERVRLDLADRPARQRLFSELNAGAKRVLVLTEGVIPYLSPEETGELAEDLRAQDRFGAWIVDYFAPEVMRYLKNLRRARHMRNAPFRFFPTDWFGLFAERGWEPKEKRYLAEESMRLGRRIPFPWWAIFFRFFSSAARREKQRRFTGYFLLGPKR